MKTAKLLEHAITQTGKCIPLAGELLKCIRDSGATYGEAITAMRISKRLLGHMRDEMDAAAINRKAGA